MKTINKIVEAVHFKDNIYLALQLEKKLEYDPEVEDSEYLAKQELEIWDREVRSNSVYCFRKKEPTFLYGGRVIVGGRLVPGNYRKLFIDGINILVLDGRIRPEQIDCQWVSNYLNAIETYGVDAFLKNYKESVKEYSQQININIEASEALISSGVNTYQKESLQIEIIKSRSILKNLLLIILLINLHMNLAIENDTAKVVFSKIEELFG